MSYEEALKLLAAVYEAGAGLTESEHIDRFNELHERWPQLAETLDDVLRLVSDD